LSDRAPEANPDRRFEKADFTASDDRWRPGSFDLVVSTDVFEHIPPISRRTFLERAARIAGRAAFIAFPAGPAAMEAELLIRSSPTHHCFKAALREHAAYGHPDLDDVAAMLEGLGLTYRVESLTTVTEWLTSFVFDLCDPVDPDLTRRYCALVNGAFAESAPPEATYRYLITIESSRGGDA
jgi:hypothetical protein